MFRTRIAATILCEDWVRAKIFWKRSQITIKITESNHHGSPCPTEQNVFVDVYHQECERLHDRTIQWAGLCRLLKFASNINLNRKIDKIACDHQ